MDFKIRIRTDTPLFFLHKKLKERHGRMNELKLYKKSVNEDNIMLDEFKTFDDYGVPGGPKSSAPVVRVFVACCVVAVCDDDGDGDGDDADSEPLPRALKSVRGVSTWMIGLW